MASVNNAEELDPLVLETQGNADHECPVQRAAVAPLWLQVVLSNSLFVVLLGLPFCNKYLFDSYLPPHDALASLTPTVVMLLGATVLLCVLALLQHWCWLGASGAGGRRWEWSVRHVLLYVLPAVAYAAVMGLTNTSLSLTSVNVHVMLRVSMLVWCVWFAWLVERERPSLAELLCCVALAGGTVMASWDVDKGVGLAGGTQVAALVLTLLSAVAQGVLLVVTRRAARLLGGRASLGLAAFKTATAAVILLHVAWVSDPEGWARLGSMSGLAAGLLVLGVFVTAAFQGLLVGMQSVTLATSAGVLSIAAVVPQVAISLAIKPQQLPPVVIAGYVLAPAAAIAYVVVGLVQRRKATAKMARM